MSNSSTAQSSFNCNNNSLKNYGSSAENYSSDSLFSFAPGYLPQDFDECMLEDFDLANLKLVIPIPIKPPKQLIEFRKSQNEQENFNNLFSKNIPGQYSLDTRNINLETKDCKIDKINVKNSNKSLVTSSDKNSVTNSCSSVAFLIEKFLREEKISAEEIAPLHQEHFIILDCLMRRKLKCGVIDYVQLNEHINVEHLKSKRLEENYKMVFKSAFKALSSKFRTISKGKRSKSDEASFYNYYFSDSTQNGQLPLESFFHPNKKLKNINSVTKANQKTMNSKYLDNLLISAKFSDDLINYLDFKFVQNYEEKRMKKIQNFVDKIEKKFLIDNATKHAELKDYLERNSKCKLPWSNYELKLAKQTVQQLLNQRATIQNAEKAFMVHSEFK